MTKADMVDRVVNKFALKKAEASRIVDMLFELMKSTLESGDHLKISGFGNFYVRNKSERRGRNPLTGESLTIESRRVLSFKASPRLREYINCGQPKMDVTCKK